MLPVSFVQLLAFRNDLEEGVCLLAPFELFFVNYKALAFDDTTALSGAVISFSRSLKSNSSWTGSPVSLASRSTTNWARSAQDRHDKNFLSNCRF